MPLRVRARLVARPRLGDGSEAVTQQVLHLLKECEVLAIGRRRIQPSGVAWGVMDDRVLLRSVDMLDFLPLKDGRWARRQPVTSRRL